jgi:hypothetical protein
MLNNELDRFSSTAEELALKTAVAPPSWLIGKTKILLKTCTQLHKSRASAEATTASTRTPPDRVRIDLKHQKQCLK